MAHKIVNTEIVEMTAEEIIAREQQEQQNLISIQAEETIKTNTETKKASGKQKLLDLGLTEEEVKALIGI